MNIKDSFRFSPEILRRLGEELVPNIDQGIVELVRNAYDADALNCTVTLFDVKAAGGRILVEDDGVGMGAPSIRDGWLVLGRSKKQSRQLTEIYKRTPVGDKGLGRLAALRLGAQTELRTRPMREPQTEYLVQIDWQAYDQAKTVEEVSLDIVQRSIQASHGTDIDIQNLRQPIARRDAERMARALVLLANPFDKAGGFSPKLKSDDYPDLVKRVERAYFDEADLHLHAWLDTEGRPHADVRNKANQVLFAAEGKDFASRTFGAPPAEFDLWEFDLSGKSFAPGVSRTDITDWLKVFGGVHIYHRGLRVLPYGDKGNDWLDINLARVRSPELRPGTNNSLGRITVQDPDERLTQKTDRFGFIEDEAFVELRRFAISVLDWMAGVRVRERDKKKQAAKVAVSSRVEVAKAALTETIAELPAAEMNKVNRAVKKLETARTEELQGLRDELLLYRTLATVGTTSAVFAHESAQPVTRIHKSATEIEVATSGDGSLFDREMIHGLASVIRRGADSVRSFAGLPIRLLRREKRKRGPLDIHSVITEIDELFRPFFEEAAISVIREFDAELNPMIVGSTSAFESILTNLLTNAAHSLIYHCRKKDKIIRIRTHVEGERVILSVIDNGQGICDIEPQDIWLAGKTTRKAGTGLGLTIVRDTVTDLGGEVHVTSPGEAGGADFHVILPLRTNQD